MKEDPSLEPPKHSSIDDYIGVNKQQFEQKLKVNIPKKDINYEKWYNLDNKIPNFKVLVEKTNDIVFNIQAYEYIYSLGSMEVHGIGAMSQLRITKAEDNLGFLSISKELDTKSIVTTVGSFIYRLAQVIVKEYGTKKDKFYKTRTSNIKRHYIKLKTSGYRIK